MPAPTEAFKSSEMPAVKPASVDTRAVSTNVRLGEFAKTANAAPATRLEGISKIAGVDIKMITPEVGLAGSAAKPGGLPESGGSVLPKAESLSSMPVVEGTKQQVPDWLKDVPEPTNAAKVGINGEVKAPSTTAAEIAGPNQQVRTEATAAAAPQQNEQQANKPLFANENPAGQVQFDSKGNVDRFAAIDKTPIPFGPAGQVESKASASAAPAAEQRAATPVAEQQATAPVEQRVEDPNAANTESDATAQPKGEAEQKLTPEEERKKMSDEINKLGTKLMMDMANGTVDPEEVKKLQELRTKETAMANGMTEEQAEQIWKQAAERLDDESGSRIEVNKDVQAKIQRMMGIELQLQTLPGDITTKRREQEGLQRELDKVSRNEVTDEAGKADRQDYYKISNKLLLVSGELTYLKNCTPLLAAEYSDLQQQVNRALGASKGLQAVIDVVFAKIRNIVAEAEYAANKALDEAG